MTDSKTMGGPWSATANSWQYTTIYSAIGTPICRLDLEDRGVTEENQSELEIEQAKAARLIAAAPALLSAAIKTVEENRHLADGDNCTLVHLVRAIAKAEGRDPALSLRVDGSEK
jgi:hypothetical protein